MGGYIDTIPVDLQNRKFAKPDVINDYVLLM